MTDLHTHILPGIDDGAKDVKVSLSMIEKTVASGATTIALTPHFYSERSTISDFLEKRNKAYEILLGAIKTEGLNCEMPRLILGAEVAFTPDLLGLDVDDLSKLAYTGTDYLLLELPFEPITNDLTRIITDLIGRTGLTPVIAHIDRHFGQVGFDDVVEMGLPTQISAEAILKDGPVGKLSMKMIKRGDAQLVISDCHNMDDRRPNLKEAYELIEKKLGKAKAFDLKAFSDRLAGDLQDE